MLCVFSAAWLLLQLLGGNNIGTIKLQPVLIQKVGGAQQMHVCVATGYGALIRASVPVFVN